MLVAVSPSVPKTPLWRWMDEADRHLHTACHGQRQGAEAFEIFTFIMTYI